MTLEEIGSRAKAVSRTLNNLGSREKNIGLEEAARALLEGEDEITSPTGSSKAATFKRPSAIDWIRPGFKARRSNMPLLMPEHEECAQNQNNNSSNIEFKIVVSKKEAYRQFGNSVAVPVIKRIAYEIVKQLM